MKNQSENLDPVSTDPVVPDGLVPDAAPTHNTPADPAVNAADLPSDPALPEAPGTPVADPESNNVASSPNPPVTGIPEASAPPSTTSKSKKPRAPRPKDPDRANKLLKKDRSGVGGPSSDEGKSVSCLNNLKHGMYSRLEFYLLPGESQEEYDDMINRMRIQYPPIDEPSEHMIQLHVQAFFRLQRCNRAEFLAEMADATDVNKHLRGLTAAGMHRARAERSFYLHLDKLKRHLADYEKQQQALREEAKQAMEKAEQEPEREPRYNEEGEEMDPDYPQYMNWKMSCDPEDSFNERYEFDRTAKGKMSVKRTPLRDYEGGRMLHPSIKPKGMKHDWPDYLLGPYQDYYKNLEKEKNPDS